MLDNIILSFNVVAPLFLEMLLGIFLRHIKLLDHHTTAAINKLIFKCFLPILLFYNIYNTRLEEITIPATFKTGTAKNSPFTSGEILIIMGI